MASRTGEPVQALLRPPSYHPGVEWAPGGKPQYVVINPMHIINLHDRTRTFAVRVVEKIKAFSERWFSHVLLMMFLLIYACLGALLFQWLEGPLEIREKQSINRTRELIIQKLSESRNLSDAEWLRIVKGKLKEYEAQFEQHLLSKAPPDSEKIVWTFWGSLFYCGTVFTTIGYGNIVPATVKGQAATIIYAFIGIPFLLMVLADLGKLFTRAIKAIFFYIKLFYHTGKLRKARKIGRRATAVPVQYMAVAWNKMPYIVYQGKRGAPDNPQRPEERDVENASSKTPDSEIKAEEKAKRKEEKDKEGTTAKDETGKENEEEIKDHAIQESAEEPDDEFNLPVSLAVFMLIVYMMLGALLFTLWEDWTFFESFYFVFISMSTIGFGDYVPDHPMFMMATFLYLLIGLSLTSMCINVMQEKLSATFEMAKLRIGTTIGLDANIIMEEDVVSDKAETPDSRRRSSSAKPRRGSKAVPHSPTANDDFEGNQDIDDEATHSKANGLNVEPLNK